MCVLNGQNVSVILIVSLSESVKNVQCEWTQLKEDSFVVLFWHLLPLLQLPAFAILTYLFLASFSAVNFDILSEGNINIDISSRP